MVSARLPTRHGAFTIHGFLDHLDGKEHSAMVRGEVAGAEDVPVRIHSECQTGDVWGSLRCDCGEQLAAALEYIQGRERGVVIYLRQEGRGIGLLNKLRAYRLQDQGADTVDANLRLCLPEDAREYGAAADILRLLGVRSVALLTNNPLKLQAMDVAGIPVVRRIALVVPANAHSAPYLQTKRDRMGHLLDSDA